MPFGALVALGTIDLDRTVLALGVADVGTAALASPQVAAEIGTIQLIELRRRNWEGNGTDTRIEADGSFVVTAQSLGRAKIVRRGQLEPTLLNRVKAAVAQAELAEGAAEREAPFKSETGWWGYDLTVTDINGKKGRVRFHSEDNTVPPALKTLVDALTGATRGS